MNVQEALLARRTIHDYRPEPLPREILLKALNAAVHAPNHKQTNPWRFYWSGPKTRQKIANLAVALKAEKAELSEAAKAAILAKYLNPAVLLVITRLQSDQPFQAREDYAAIAGAVQNLSLSLWADGYGSKWSTGGITQDPRVFQWLGIDSLKEAIEGFIWAGVWQRVPPKPPKPDLSQILFECP